MSTGRKMKIALTGKPNSGKSSLFNQLTGLNQKIGNFPGITVDKKTGQTSLDENTSAEILDLPGIYSLYPRSLDERIVVEVFSNNKGAHFPDKVVLVADATNLKNCMLLLTQLIDLGLPTVLALNMLDLAAKSGLSIDIKKLAALLDVPVVLINARNGQGISELKKLLARPLKSSQKKIFPISDEVKPVVELVRDHFKLTTDYEAFQYLQQPESFIFLSNTDKEFIQSVAYKHQFFPAKYQGAETIQRYEFIQSVLNKVILKAAGHEWKKLSKQIDRVLTVV